MLEEQEQKEEEEEEEGYGGRMKMFNEDGEGKVYM